MHALNLLRLLVLVLTSLSFPPWKYSQGYIWCIMLMNYFTTEIYLNELMENRITESQNGL